VAPQVSENGVPAACAAFRRSSHGCEVAGGPGAVGGCCARAAIPIAATTVNVMLCDFFMWISRAFRRKYASLSLEMRKNLASGRNSTASGRPGSLRVLPNLPSSYRAAFDIGCQPCPCFGRPYSNVAAEIRNLQEILQQA
jgi:hypothetical protein